VEIVQHKISLKQNEFNDSFVWEDYSKKREIEFQLVCAEKNIKQIVSISPEKIQNETVINLEDKKKNSF
jgi:hypothetical protein